ncbi:hypothetical protein KCP73_23220 [Salmonella enterica subsp. enterica]|nr:hypothetical protein KCP73_23220 [Salmonella enterica subsp. enterica]
MSLTLASMSFACASLNVSLALSRGGRFFLTCFCTGVSLVSRVWTVLTGFVKVRYGQCSFIYPHIEGYVVAASYHHG